MGRSFYSIRRSWNSGAHNIGARFVPDISYSVLDRFCDDSMELR